jgi:hypothetical protein
MNPAESSKNLVFTGIIYNLPGWLCKPLAALSKDSQQNVVSASATTLSTIGRTIIRHQTDVKGEICKTGPVATPSGPVFTKAILHDPVSRRNLDLGR